MFFINVLSGCFLSFNDKCHLVENDKKIFDYICMNKVFLKKLGKNIRYVRKSKNLSQEKLAELIKKTRNYVGMVERAEINIPVGALYDFSKALNVDIKTFFDF